MVEEKKMVPRCLLQLASETKPYALLTELRSDEFLNYLVEREKRGKRWESKKSAGKEKNCVKQAAGYKCLGQRVEQMLSAAAGVWKRAALDRLFPLLKYDLIARRLRAEEGTEFVDWMKIQVNEARV